MADIAELFPPNEGKNLCIDTVYGRYARYPVKTKVVHSGDSLFDILDEYVRPYLKSGDTIIMSEKIVAISQGRAFPVSEIKVSRLARFLVKFVHKSPVGIGIGAESTMELCVREVGRAKVVFAAIIGALFKLFGIRGMFYRICGMKARAIDGPAEYNLPPYDKYAKMAPDRPDEVAAELTAHIDKWGENADVVIIDANDLGANVLGKKSPSYDSAFAIAVFADNPLGQGRQQTPIAIVRKVEE